MIRKATCKKCKSVNINITWKYAKEDEIAMYLCHDGFGFQFEDATMKCGDCGSRNLVNAKYNMWGKLIEE